MKKKDIALTSLASAMMAISLTACNDDDDVVATSTDAKYIGQNVGNFDKSEWYPGGELGTTENVTSHCYEDESPAVTAQGLLSEFKHGELFFERQYTINNKPFNGLGPAYVRSSCLDCHPNYGHGRRMNSYTTSYGNGNGYLLVVYHPVDGANSNDGKYVDEVTGMPQTRANGPFKAPIDESKVNVKWEHITAMESGLPMQFPDGEKYDLIYPVVNIPRDAFRTNPNPYDTKNKAVAFRLESTIGVIGTGMLDAISEDDIKAQYAATAKYYQESGKDVSEYVNPNFWNAGANDFTDGAYYTATIGSGKYADGSEGKKMVKRFTYALTRATLQDGPGANAIWNITNVTRPDRPKLYTTDAWAKAMAEDEEVIKRIMADPTSPFYATTEAETKEKVENLLSPSTNQFDNQWSGQSIKPEMSADDFYDFMVWHRGLSIPRARNLNDADVQRGKKIFNEIGCANCHRAKWTTGDDNYWTPNMIAGKPLPRYAHQTIYPYTDMMQHKLYMKNDIHGSWCRTTPLWGRGLSYNVTGAEDRLHDCRARNEVEAIMWHAYSKNSHAYDSALKFYNLKKADRDAVVKFLRSI